MGKRIQGEWITDDKLGTAEAVAYQHAVGKLERGTAGFRNWVTSDGSAGPSVKVLIGRLGEADAPIVNDLTGVS